MPAVEPGRRARRAAALLAVAVAAACTGGEEARDAGVARRDAGVPATEPLHAYRVTYRVRELDQVRDEEVLVRRPYESRRTSQRDGRIVGGRLTNADGLWQWVAFGERGWQLVDPGRHRAEADARPLGSLPPLVDAGLAELRGTAEVAGRACTLVRTREPVGDRAVRAPTDADHAELCVDATDVILRERWVIDGRVVRERDAVAFEAGPVAADDDFAARPLAAAGQGRSVAGRELIEVDDEVLRTTVVDFDLPARVEADGAVAWVERDATGSVAGASLRRFYRAGDDLAEVEERETAAIGEHRGTPVRTPVGEGFLESDLQRLTLVVPLDGGIAVLLRASNGRLLDDMVDGLRLRPRRD